MARSRNIKPGFFTNDELAECSPYARLLFAGLWTIADREGRGEDRPKKIKVLVLPFDSVDVNELMQALHERGFIRRYEVEGEKYFQICNWSKHQNPHHKEIASVIPSPPEHKDTVCEGYVPLSNTIRDAIKKRDGEKCNYCGSNHELEIDHILPVSKGGNSNAENLQVLCKQCNILKFNHIVNQEECLKQRKVILASSMNQEQVMEIASCPTDTLNLIPDSLNLIPSNNTQAAEATCAGEDNVHPMASRYAFEGKVVRLNQKDFDSWKTLFKNIDLISELTRLDLEFTHEKPKNWFSTASAKLNYQNKNAARQPIKRVANESFATKDYGQTDIPSWAME
ncbi:HNH endonuclease [Serratia marcescens]